MTDVFDCKASPAMERMTSDWEAGGKHADYKREKDPVERSEAKQRRGRASKGNKKR